MRFYSDYFEDPQSHHSGYFRVFRGKHIVEVWVGHRYYTLAWR